MRRRQLSNRIFASVVGILLASTLVGFALTTLNERAHLERQSQQRALAIAQTFAADPSIRIAIARRTPADRQLIRSLAAQVARETGAAYVVVLDRNGVRYSHPNPKLIGRRVSEPVIALDGHTHVGTDHGNLGLSANAKAPIFGPGGGEPRVVGEVSTGILERHILDQLLGELPTLLLYFLGALGIGVVASVTLARRLKRSTFGLELDEIAALVQEREAMLHEIREGVIVLDPAGRISLVNDEARRLLKLAGTAEPVVGHWLTEVLGPGRLQDLLTGTSTGRDGVVLSDDHVLVVNRVAVTRDGRDLGTVVTLRDRTELEGLLRELDNVDQLTNALRAQQHEFANRMHTVAGLIELGDHDQAAAYALETTATTDGLSETIRARVEPKELAAMLLAKTTIAAERGVQLTLTDDSSLPDTGELTSPLLTIVGNLINNALDAASLSPGGEVTVLLARDAARIRVEVTDSGPGIPAHLRDQIFADGFTTKGELGHRNQGLGLALVHRLVHRAGGTITVSDAPPTRFTVLIPAPALVLSRR